VLSEDPNISGKLDNIKFAQKINIIKQLYSIYKLGPLNPIINQQECYYSLLGIGFISEFIYIGKLTPTIRR
jgi:hypothetical protein